jgi:subtilase family serine protease
MAKAQFTPAAIRQAYGFNLLSANYTSGTTGAGQTIAIIDAYGAVGDTTQGQSNLYSDVNQFDSQYGLPALSAGTSLQVMNQTGDMTAGNLPAYNFAWAKETTLDVEYAHAIAPGATIELVEAASNNYSDLFTASNYAASHGASVVSMSFSGSEDTDYDSNFGTAGVTFVASTGDGGSAGGVAYPASNPNVVAVGGTTLKTNGDGSYAGESAWSGSGGGTSQFELRPSYQIGVQPSTYRTVPDVAFDADSSPGVDIYFDGGTTPVGGTSIGSPCWAGLFALADEDRAANGLSALSSFSALQAMYATYGSNAYSMAFHDIVGGTDGAYTATTGYDEVTGLGSPIANELVPYLGGSESLADLIPEPTSVAMVFIAFPLLMRRARWRR